MATDTQSPTDQDYQHEQKNRDRIALVISILFVLAIGLLGYRFLNNSSNIRTALYNVKEQGEERLLDQNEGDIIASNTTRDEENADSNENSDSETTQERAAEDAQDQANVNQPEVEDQTSNQESQDNSEVAQIQPEQQQNQEATQNQQPEQAEIVTAPATDTTTTGIWQANNYNQGDIDAGSNYTVQEGDTLWELAEAAYGNGAEWGRILQANSNDIGFLANGQQALIMTGQTLVIPSMT